MWYLIGMTSGFGPHGIFAGGGGAWENCMEESPARWVSRTVDHIAMTNTCRRILVKLKEHTTSHHFRRSITENYQQPQTAS